MRTHTKTFHIRFTEREYERLCRYAEKSGLPKTTYIRHLLNGCCPRENSPEFWPFIKQVHALGNNLNQLAHLAHRFGSLHAAELDEALERYHQLIRDLYDRLYTPEDIDIPAILERGRQFTQSEEELQYAEQ